MNTLEFIDRLFDALNESQLLPTKDLTVNYKQNSFDITLWDGSQFHISCTTLDNTSCADILCFPYVEH